MATITREYVFPFTSFLDGLAKGTICTFDGSLRMANKREEPNSFCNRHVFSRIAQLPMILLEVVSRTVDLVIGIFSLPIFLVFHALTLVDDTIDPMPWRRYSFSHLREGEVLLSEVYLRLLRACSLFPDQIRYNRNTTSYNTDGYVTSLSYKLMNWGSQATDNSNPIMKHLVSRVYYVAALLFGIFARVADLAIAVVTVPVSFALLGTYEGLNNVAYRSLKVGALLTLIAHAVAGIINPKVTI